MHGTFRGRIDEDAGITVRFDTRASQGPVSRKWPAKVAVLLAGCCAAALPVAPTRDVELAPSSRHKRATAPAQIAEAYPIRRIISRAPAARARQASPSSLPTPPPPKAIEPTNVEKAIEAAVPRDVPSLALAPSPLPPVVVNLPYPTAELVAAEPPQAPSPVTPPKIPQLVLRPVDVMQIADSEARLSLIHI